MTITIGIDPHMGSHTAVAIDSNEHVLDEIRVRSCSTQTVRRRDWAERFEERTWAVESAHGLGYLLAQQLVAAGENVIDVPPVRASRVRVLGSGKSQKNDPNDARSVAIAALRAEDLATVCADDRSRVLKLLSKRHREPRQVEEQGVLSTPRPAPRDGSWRRQLPDHDRYNVLLDASKQRINTALAASATTLTSIGVGPIWAAMIIGESGNIDRFASKHHFASYNATAPVEASSGPKFGIDSTRAATGN